MQSRVDIVKRMYGRFNARDIDGVLDALGEEVVWANGMDGGYEEGKVAVRAYWTRQWALVHPTVEPVTFHYHEDGALHVEATQRIRDAEERPVQQGGLQSATVLHVFRFDEHGKVIRFDLGGA